jgi:hypothetical protein
MSCVPTLTQEAPGQDVSQKLGTSFCVHEPGVKHHGRHRTRRSGDGHELLQHSEPVPDREAGHTEGMGVGLHPVPDNEALLGAPAIIEVDSSAHAQARGHIVEACLAPASGPVRRAVDQHCIDP